MQYLFFFAMWMLFVVMFAKTMRMLTRPTPKPTPMADGHTYLDLTNYDPSKIPNINDRWE